MIDGTLTLSRSCREVNLQQGHEFSLFNDHLLLEVADNFPRFYFQLKLRGFFPSQLQ